METLYDANNATLTFDDKNEILIGTWDGFISENDFIDILNKALLIIKERKARFWIADNRKLKVFTKAVQDYIASEWVPRALQAGVKKLAVITSENVFAKQSEKATLDKLKKTPDFIGTFQSIEDAKEWFTRN